MMLIQSPLRGKIQERLFGPPPSDDDDLPQITLPDDDRHIEITEMNDPSKVEADPAADVVGSAAVHEAAPHAGRGQGHNDVEPIESQETNA